METKIELELHKNMATLAEAYALVATFPVTILPSSEQPWSYIVRQEGCGHEFDRSCGLGSLVATVKDVLAEGEYGKHQENDWCQIIMARLKEKQEQ